MVHYLPTHATDRSLRPQAPSSPLRGDILTGVACALVVVALTAGVVAMFALSFANA
jgi:hypothetical protein